MKSTPHRLRYPAVSVFLLAGIAGSGINLCLAALLYYRFGVGAGIAFFISTLANELFHHLYYHVVHVNQEIRLRTPLPTQISLYVVVAAASGLFLTLLMRCTGGAFIASVLVALLTLAILNTLVNRLSTFSSAKLAMVEYEQMTGTFYSDQTDRKKVNWFRAWFHQSRFSRLKALVLTHYRPGMAVADLGCGNCMWNDCGIPVVGVDANQPMMKWAAEHGRLASYHVTADLSNTGLPDRSMNIVIMSETLEHLLDFEQVIREVRRILGDDGVFLITVPYDIFLGPFFILFNLNCLWQGFVKGSVYHRFRCGHVNHFTVSRLRNALGQSGFNLQEVKLVNCLSLYAVAKKTFVTL
jgi:SAM-dependent methyltransferase